MLDQPLCPYDGPLSPIWEPDPEDPDNEVWVVFEVSELTAEQLAEMLRAYAHGLYAEEAAVELVIAHRHWLCSPTFRAHVTAFLGDAVDGRVPMASIGWHAVLRVLGEGGLYASDSEAAILQVAASLACRGITVGLREAVVGLDERNAGLVALAIAHAAGHRQEWPS